MILTRVHLFVIRDVNAVISADNYRSRHESNAFERAELMRGTRRRVTLKLSDRMMPECAPQRFLN